MSTESDDPIWGFKTCRHCKRPLYMSNLWVADGCPCNSGRGINHGIVPVDVCTCEKCDPANTGSSRNRGMAAPESKVEPPPFPLVHGSTNVTVASETPGGLTFADLLAALAKK